MTDTSSSTSFSNAGIVADMLRLIAPSHRPSFSDMLQHELQGRGELPADEVRRVAEWTRHRLLKEGWPRA